MQFPPSQPVGFVAPEQYGAKGDGTTDDRTALGNAIAVASALGGLASVRLRSNYKISKYVDLNGLRHVTLWGGGKVIYPSDDVSVGADSVANTTEKARSAFLARFCRHLTFKGITFEGGTQQDGSTVNLGHGVYATRSTNVHLVDCVARFGASIFVQDATTGSTSTGTSIAVSGSVVTVTAASAPFSPGHVDGFIKLSKTNDNRNAGEFPVVTYISATQVTIANPNAVAEVSSFRLVLDDDDRAARIDRCTSYRVRGSVHVPNDSTISKSIWEYPATQDLTGLGDSFAISGSTVTLTNKAGAFLPSVDGKYIVIAEATTSANNGTYGPVTYISANQVSYANGSGASETYTGAWWVPNGDRAGLGGGASAISLSGTTVTFTAAANAFAASMVGDALRVISPTTPANAGSFNITSVISATQVTYENAAAVSEAFAGLWTMDSFDRVTSNVIGSSHAIYLFAGHSGIVVDGCVFRYNRTTCVKVSGSTSPLRGIKVVNCKAIECGSFVVAGADDVNEHTDISVMNNEIFDCATGRNGWSPGGAIAILGSRNVNVSHNQFYYTRNSISGVSGVSTGGLVGIQISRYVPGISQPVEQFTCVENGFSAHPGNTSSQILQSAISVSDVGGRNRWNTAGTLTKSGTTMTLADGAAEFSSSEMVGLSITFVNSTNSANNGTYTILSVPTTGSLTFTNGSGVAGSLGGTYRVAGKKTFGGAMVARNQIHHVATIGITTSNCLGPEVVDNVFSGLIHDVQTNGDVTPRIAGNREVGRNTTSGGLWIKLGTSWPIVHDNTITNQAIGPVQSHAIDVSTNGTTTVDFPLLGKSGRARPTGALEEVVFAYGSQWVDGDTVTVDGTVYTYKTSGPSGAQFNTFAGLVVLINAQSGYTCVDYGTGFAAGSIATQHLWIRKTAQTSSDGTFAVSVSTLNATAAPLLRNSDPVSAASCLSRGSGTLVGVPVPDGTIAWSPLATLAGGMTLWADNAAGQTLLQASGWRPVKLANDSACCETLKHGSAAGTEEFRWAAR